MQGPHIGRAPGGWGRLEQLDCSSVSYLSGDQQDEADELLKGTEEDQVTCSVS